MFMVSWQLSILAFISVPVITVLSKWYGNFVRGLTKVMQTKLAEGNSVSEAAISSMPTVRAFDAAPTEYKEFETYMDQVGAVISNEPSIFATPPSFYTGSNTFCECPIHLHPNPVSGAYFQGCNRLQWVCDRLYQSSSVSDGAWYVHTRRIQCCSNIASSD